jgi:hypothetical protein
MGMNVQYSFVTGDWVQGKSRSGELIHGYIVSTDEIKGIIKVNVVESDNENVIGKSIWLQNKFTEKLPETTLMNEGQISSLIDIALLTKDENWFDELTSKLISLRNTSKASSEVPSVSYYNVNRIRNSETRG